jgi:hypothetical protein
MAVDISVDQRYAPFYTIGKQHPGTGIRFRFHFIVTDNSTYTKADTYKPDRSRSWPKPERIKTRLLFANNPVSLKPEYEY